MIDVEYWFSTPLWFVQLDEIDNSKIEKYAKNLSKKSPGRQLSNYGGWQSDDFYLNDCPNEELLKVSTIVQEKIRECGIQLNQLPNTELNISNFWININQKGDGNRVHTHPNSIFSAVYYVAANENSGKIVFQQPNNFLEYWWRSISDGNTFATYDTVSVNPSPGKLVIFPSWLKHYVEENSSTKSRISIAYNSGIDSI